jgi:DNA-binding NarL/FixJ family response regulator
MIKKVMVIDNSKATRDEFVNRLCKSPDCEVIYEGELDPDTMNRIDSMRPELVFINLLPSEYETAKGCIGLLLDDKSVKFLTLSRYANRYLMIALYDVSPADQEYDDSFINRIFSLEDELSGYSVTDSAIRMGKYILKGASLKCA